MGKTEYVEHIIKRVLDEKEKYIFMHKFNVEDVNKLYLNPSLKKLTEMTKKDKDFVLEYIITFYVKKMINREWTIVDLIEELLNKTPKFQSVYEESPIEIKYIVRDYVRSIY